VRVLSLKSKKHNKKKEVKVMRKILAITLIFFAIGCKKYVRAPEEPVKLEEVKAEEVKKEVEVKKAEVVEEKILPREAKEVAATVIEKPLFELKDALFDFDRYDIRPDARTVLDSIASWLNKNRDINVLIEGHCDERGTNEYNLALGEKRAQAAKDYLISKGITLTRMNTISYGEEKPTCTEQNEDCWQKNRRAHFVVTK
jgi:peptidoglycan-associated lipoprotein